MYRLPLPATLFAAEEQVILQSDAFTVSTKRYPQNIASLTIINRRGHLELLPFMGQIIWDAVFDGHSLRMKNMFARPQHLWLLRLPFRSAQRRLPGTGRYASAARRVSLCPHGSCLARNW